VKHIPKQQKGKKAQMKAIIIYETLTGTTQYVAEVMKDELVATGFTVDLHSVRYQGHQLNLKDYDLILFGAPTYEDGKLEQGMRVFIARTKEDFSQYNIAVFGLGNSTYPHFCASADILEEWVKKNNGTPLVPTLRIDGFPDDLTPITQWISEVCQKIASL
jgi:flavodoxin I